MDERRRRRATLIGAAAILLWSTLAVLTTATGSVPPFLLVALAFGVAFVLAATVWIVRGQDVVGHLRQPGRVWALGVAGLFGYHALYFVALKSASPVEANLLNYLWPLLIVIFSAFLPGEAGLRWWHVLGAATGFAGTIVIVTAGGADGRESDLVGLGAAAGCAVVWSGYSVLSRRFGSVPTDSVGGFCGATALLAGVCHLAFESGAAWPHGNEWLAIAVLGAGPTGLAFFAWDHGVKHGDIRALGGFSYATPLLSTALLLAFGGGAATPAIAIAGVLIVGGAVLAARDLWAPRRPITP